MSKTQKGHMETIFNNKGLKLLQDDMSLCIDNLSKKILYDAPEFIDFFRDLADYMSELFPPYCEDEFSPEQQEYINNHLLSFASKYGIEEDKIEVYFIFDNLRHVFLNYRIGGLLQAHTNREAECWYPKMIIRKRLLSEKDFDQINDEVIIYRGMSENEYLGGSFGQAWTTDIEIANKFAFQHYANHPKYEDTVRVVAKTKIHKKNIYWYEDYYENEVLIDEREVSKSEVELVHREVL